MSEISLDNHKISSCILALSICIPISALSSGAVINCCIFSFSETPVNLGFSLLSKFNIFVLLDFSWNNWKVFISEVFSTKGVIAKTVFKGFHCLQTLPRTCWNSVGFHHNHKLKVTTQFCCKSIHSFVGTHQINNLTFQELKSSFISSLLTSFTDPFIIAISSFLYNHFSTKYSDILSQ